MQDYGQLEECLTTCLQLDRRPVAITFSDRPADPYGQPNASQPAGCSFWRLAAQGQTCHTEASDHYNCAVGSHTHNLPLPESRRGELGQTLGLMTESGYLSMQEVPDIAQLERTPATIIYAPLADTAQAPDVVLIAGPAAAMMLLHEAAIRAGAKINNGLSGRPSCMVLPAAMQSGVTASFGCIGNRVYTDIADGALYIAIPGRDIGQIVAALPGIAAANQQLQQWHTTRRAELTD